MDHRKPRFAASSHFSRNQISADLSRTTENSNYKGGRLDRQADDEKQAYSSNLGLDSEVYLKRSDYTQAMEAKGLWVSENEGGSLSSAVKR